MGDPPLKICHFALVAHDATADALEARVEWIAGRGFSTVCVAGLFASSSAGLLIDHERTAFADSTPESVVDRLRRACAAHDMTVAVDIALDRLDARGPTAQVLAGAYAVSPAVDPLDPRHKETALTTARLQPAAATRAADWWAGRLRTLTAAGAGAFRLTGLPDLPPGFLAMLADGASQGNDRVELMAWTPGLPWARHQELKAAGVAAVFASTCWWDGQASWYAEEIEALRRIAPVIGVAIPPQEAGNHSLPGSPESASVLARHVKTAAASTDGLFVCADRVAVMSCSTTASLEAATVLVGHVAGKRLADGVRTLTGPGTSPTLLLRTDADPRYAKRGVVIAVNGTRESRAMPRLAVLPAGAGAAFSAEGPVPDLIAPDEVLVRDVSAVEMVGQRAKAAGRATRAADRRSALKAAQQTPLVIDNPSPCVPSVAGPATFAAKHVVGRALVIEADIYADGHDLLAAEVSWWADDEKDRKALPLIPTGNDRWRATVLPARIGRHYYFIEAWRDDYGSLVHALDLKHRAGIGIEVEVEEAATYLAGLDDPSSSALATRVRTMKPDEAVALLTAGATREKVAARLSARGERRQRATLGPVAVEVERPQAEFAAWYELFPRSMTDDPARHGTFEDVIGALPRVRAMGFDVLYFPPIHPIGRAHRKGRNNSLTAGPDDVGSPYAIGGDAGNGTSGGHDTIHPELGTIEDFRRLMNAAREQGLEIALDFAIQCSPDHPWLKDHPEWFRRRPDGTIKYAENPPKKYEDIVNVDFHGDGAVPDLWLALRDVVLFWAGEGVRIFRVDNPHTKPLPFWQWMIADVRARHPDAIFLSEAFTRPKVMYRLAAVGFSQSYTYFTWRNKKQELVDYLRELTSPPVVDYFRPHFFVNTPDINPVFLQTSGRGGFLSRAALAATLSGLWGVYSGFEICEAAALPGREEYLDSEKYEIRPRDFTAPGNIATEIALLNRLRRAHPALQSHRGVTFYNVFNDKVLLYGKRMPDEADMILVAVSLDPGRAQDAAFELPLWEWKLPDDGALAIEDLVRGGRWVWRGKHQHLRLEPSMPFALWRLSAGPGDPR